MEITRNGNRARIEMVLFNWRALSPFAATETEEFHVFRAKFT